MNIKTLLTVAFLACGTCLAFGQDFKDEEATVYTKRLSMLEGEKYNKVKEWAKTNPLILQIQNDSSAYYDEIVVMATTRRKNAKNEFIFSNKKLELQLMGRNESKRLFTFFYDFKYDLKRNKVSSSKLMKRVQY